MTKRPTPTSGIPFAGNGNKGGNKRTKWGSMALAAAGWLSTFAVLWLWVFDLIARDALSSSLLVFSLGVAILASAIASGK